MKPTIKSRVLSLEFLIKAINASGTDSSQESLTKALSDLILEQQQQLLPLEKERAEQASVRTTDSQGEPSAKPKAKLQVTIKVLQDAKPNSISCVPLPEMAPTASGRGH